jgi:hypothetical protein
MLAMSPDSPCDQLESVCQAVESICEVAQVQQVNYAEGVAALMAKL